jgi:hypothetical protein
MKHLMQTTVDIMWLGRADKKCVSHPTRWWHSIYTEIWWGYQLEDKKI